jgi:nucleotide-binding universal stress UspA family protein
MRVILATDGSDDARAAAEWLGHFPLPRSARVLTLAVEPVPYAVPDMLMIPALDERARAAVTATAEGAREIVAPRYPNAEPRVVEGDPREQIVRVADEWAADLIVVGARGLTGLKEFVLGSVSSAVVRWAPCPVLVVKGRCQPLDRVVIGVDGSPDSMTAARFFASLPLERRTAVRLVAVVQPPAVPLSAMTMRVQEIEGMLSDFERERRTVLAGALGRLEGEFRDRVRTVEQSVLLGRPADVLVTESEHPDVGLVVVGARGLGPLKRLLLGSVSEQVLHRVGCPILVVKRRA